MAISLQRSNLTRSIKSLSACIWCPAVNMTSYRYQDLDGEAKIRYLRKLELCGLNVCPYQLPADAWKNEPTQWPNLEWPEIYDYLVNTPGIYTREAMKNRKSLEAHNQFSSGWVRTVIHYNVPAKKQIILMKADVMPSQRLNETPHVPWVAISKKNDNIIAAHCTCMAG